MRRVAVDANPHAAVGAAAGPAGGKAVAEAGNPWICGGNLQACEAGAQGQPQL